MYGRITGSAITHPITTKIVLNRLFRLRFILADEPQVSLPIDPAGDSATTPWMIQNYLQLSTVDSQLDNERREPTFFNGFNLSGTLS